MRSSLFLWISGCLALLASLSAADTPPQAPAESQPEQQVLEALWSDLAGDAAKAYRAIWALTSTPREAVAFIEAHQPPAVPPDPKKLAQWISDLNSERFGVRERATRELEKLGELAEPALQATAKTNLPLEVRQRIEKLLAKMAGPLTLPEQLREVRAVEALEYIGSAEAQALLRKYAAGAAGARLTREAREALDRLGRRSTERPPAIAPQGRPRTDLYGDPLPPGALVRLGTLRFRRDGSFDRKALSFLPDGKTLLTVQGQLIQFWGVPDGRLVRELATDPIDIQGFALAPDGKQFAVAGTHPWLGPNMPGLAEVQVYDLASGKPVRSVLRKDNEDVYHSQLAFSPDGKLLFSVGYSGVLRVEEVATGRELLQKKLGSDYVQGLAVSPDGDYLAVAPGPNTHKFYLWKWRREEPQPIPIGDRRVQGIRFSPDGKLLATIFDYTGDMQVWEVSSRRSLYQWNCPEQRYYLSGQPMFTPDGKSLLVAIATRRGDGPGKTFLLEPRTGRTQATLPVGSGGGAVSSDGRLLAVPRGNGVRLWDLATRKEIAGNDAAHWSAPSHVLVSPKGFLATTSRDNSVRLWDAGTGKQQRKYQLSQWVRDIALSPDGRLLAASSFDDPVHVWDVASGRAIYRLAGHGQYGRRRTLGFLPDSRGLLSWGDDFYLRLWDMKTGKGLLEHAIRPSGLKMPDLEDPSAKRDEKFALRLGEAIFTPDGKTFLLNVAGNYHGFDTGTGSERFKFPGGQSGMSSTLALSPDGNYLLVSGFGSSHVGNHSVSVLDASSGKRLRRITLPGSSHGTFVFSADGRSFAATIQPPQGKIVIYEMASGEVRCTLGGLRTAVRSLRFFPDLRRLASGLDDSTVLIWDLEERARLSP